MDWKKAQLSELASFRNGKRRPSIKGNIPVYGGNGILDYAGQNNFENCISIGRVGAYCGNVFLSNSKCWISDNAIAALPKENISLFFLYYLLKNLQLNKMCIGSGQPLLTQGILNSIEVSIPDAYSQRKIGCILAAIDDKIALNQQINKNLEEQAQAIYDELFADVTYNATLSDLGTVVGGSTPSKKHPEYYTEKGIAWITPKDLSNDSSKYIYHGENDITELGLSKCSASLMPAGTVLFSSRAPIGYTAIAANPVATNQGFKSVIPKKEIGTAFVYCFLKNNLNVIESMASGSTFKEISAGAMKTVPAFLPDADKLQRFREFCNPVFKYQQSLERENIRLSQMRNALLPRLMSGEIDVSSIEI